MRVADQQDDILAKWRLKNQMEIARHIAGRVESTPTSAPARHHFVRSTARPVATELPSPAPLPVVAKEVRETGTQMSTPVSSIDRSIIHFGKRKTP